MKIYNTAGDPYNAAIQHISLDVVTELQMQLALIAHVITHQPENPLPDNAWSAIFNTFTTLQPITQSWRH